MRLSEAIRLGATMLPQTFSRLFSYATIEDNLANKPNGSCAVGGALLASGHDYFADVDEWKDVRLTITKCPHSSCPIMSSAFVSHLIPHLNDTHRWTREAIADFVELHEPMPIPESIRVENEELVEVLQC